MSRANTTNSQSFCEKIDRVNVLNDADDEYSRLVRDALSLNNVSRYQDAADRAKAAAAIRPQEPRAYIAWAIALRGLGQLARSVEVNGTAVQLDPSNSVAFQTRAFTYMQMGSRVSKKQRHEYGEKAASDAQEAVRLEPNNVNCLSLLAQASAVKGDVKEANVAIQQVIQRSPNSAATWIAASRVALASRDWDAATEACKRALALDASNYAALNNLGVAQRAAGHRLESNDTFAQAARLRPNDLTARWNLARNGLMTARIAILVILVPIGFAAHVGLGLYVIFGIGSNIFISRNPGVVLKFERWMAPIALKMRRRPKGPLPPQLNSDTTPERFYLDRQWAVHKAYRLGNSAMVLLASAIWLGALAIAVFAGLDPQAAGPLLIIAFVVALFAVIPTLELRRRRRSQA